MQQQSPPTPRPFRPADDFAALLALLNAIEAEDQVGEGATAESLHEGLTLPDHDPAADRWVVDTPDQRGEIVGHASLWKPAGNTRADIEVAVWPARRRQGNGPALLACVLARARALGTQQVGAYADDRHRAGEAFLRAAGFRPVGAYVQLVATDPVREPATLPAGYRLRHFAAPDDWAVLNAAMNGCFADQWGHQPLTEADTRRWLDKPEFQPDGIWIAFDRSDTVAGVIRAERREDLAAKYGTPAGYIDAPGIAPGHPDGLLRRGLLQTACAWLAAQGQPAAEMESWGDSLEALALYEQQGFRTTRRATAYGLDL